MEFIHLLAKPTALLVAMPLSYNFLLSSAIRYISRNLDCSYRAAFFDLDFSSKFDFYLATSRHWVLRKPYFANARKSFLPTSKLAPLIFFWTDLTPVKLSDTQTGFPFKESRWVSFVVSKEALIYLWLARAELRALCFTGRVLNRIAVLLMASIKSTCLACCEFLKTIGEWAWVLLTGVLYDP